MSHHRPRGTEGTNAAWQVTGLGMALGVMVARAHEDGMAAIKRGHEERAQAAHDAWVSAELANAKRLAEALAAERAENARLRRALAQRQAYIESLRS